MCLTTQSSTVVAASFNGLVTPNKRISWMTLMMRFLHFQSANYFVMFYYFADFSCSCKLLTFHLVRCRLRSLLRRTCGPIHLIISTMYLILSLPQTQPHHPHHTPPPPRHKTMFALRGALHFFFISMTDRCAHYFDAGC